MRFLCVAVMVVTLNFFSLAQSIPQGFSYQAVARDSGGFVLENASMTVTVSLRSGSENGNLEWQETHAVSTNQFGLFSLVIGQGNSTGQGSRSQFADMDWNLQHYTGIAINFGSGDLDMGSSRLWAVPYALKSLGSSIWQEDGGDIYRNTGQVTLGLENNALQSGARLTVYSDDTNEEPTVRFQGDKANLFMGSYGEGYAGKGKPTTIKLEGHGKTWNILRNPKWDRGSSDFTIYSPNGSGLHNDVGTFPSDDTAATYHGALTGLVIRAENGNVGIGMTDPEYKLQVAGAIAPRYHGNYNLGSITRSWYQIHTNFGLVMNSDRRLKKDIEDLEYGLDEILALRPVTYFWKKGLNEKRQIGFIAQEVQPLIDEMVTVDDGEEKLMGVQYDRLIPVLTKAVQELAKEKDQLVAQNQDMQARLARLEAMMEQMNNDQVHASTGAGR